MEFLDTGWMDWFSHGVFGKESLPLDEWKRILCVRQTQWFITGLNVGQQKPSIEGLVCRDAGLKAFGVMNREMFSDCFFLRCENQGFINNKIPVCVISLIGIISETITLCIATVKSVSNVPTGIFIKAVWIVLSAWLEFVPQKQSCSCPAHPGAGRDAVWIQ